MIWYRMKLKNSGIFQRDVDLVSYHRQSQQRKGAWGSSSWNSIDTSAGELEALIRRISRWYTVNFMMAMQIYFISEEKSHFRGDKGNNVDHKLKIGRLKLSLQVNKEELPTSHTRIMITKQ